MAALHRYRYEDGRSESRTFGPYKKGKLTTPFLDYSWTWGYTPKIERGQLYYFETCLKHERLGVSGGCKYLEDGSLHHVTSIWETLDFFRGEPKEIDYTSSDNWKGSMISTITPDLIIATTSDCQWKPIDELAQENIIVSFSHGVTVSLPERYAYDRESLIITDWLVNPGLLKRGIRHYNQEILSLFPNEFHEITSSNIYCNFFCDRINWIIIRFNNNNGHNQDQDQKKRSLDY
ncbi:MAG: DUF3598 family protein [Moorea sp. SIO4A1]|nr:MULTISPECIES: DUF3598 family protein [unclassified Moorena]NEO20442.1 DUF3598 family protein [Moorena sp. SIO4A5]NEQ59978.1 DUF3598 family protein [Moorena sp. SIO4A1]